MMAIVLATLIGGVVTGAAFMPLGPLVAILAAPFGGSAAALVASMTLYGLRSRDGGQAASVYAPHGNRVCS